jgi:hypothetical protein
VVHREEATTDENFVDLAIIQLDRPATPTRQPIALSLNRPLVGDTILAAAHGAGLPLKVESNASIATIAEEANFFVAATDSFGGGSGGGLFNTELELVGYQVRGLSDWAIDGGCIRAAEGDEPSEEHQLAAISIAALCDGGWPSTRLCDTPPTCGDDICSGTENFTNCVADCNPPSCGDGLCELSEHFSCAEDCSSFSQVPTDWAQDPQQYLDALNEHDATDGIQSNARENQSGCSLKWSSDPSKSQALLVFVLLGWLMRMTKTP